jgi:hypothetical protein
MRRVVTDRSADPLRENRMHSEERLGSRVQRLETALGQLADALASGDLDGMLAAEPALALAVASLETPAAPVPDRDAVRAALLQAREALRRCERLGAGLDRFVSCALTAQEHALSYERDGGTADRPGRHALTARV